MLPYHHYLLQEARKREQQRLEDPEFELLLRENRPARLGLYACVLAQIEDYRIAVGQWLKTHATPVR